MNRLRHQVFVFATLLATSVAQQHFTTLIKSRPELSNLTAYFDLHPDLVKSILRWPNKTYLAPSDEAFAQAAHSTNDAFQIMSLDMKDIKNTDIPAIFSYHTVDHVVRSFDFWHGPHIVPTTLVDPTYTALPGGQVFVGTGVQGQQPVLTSGVQAVSNIVVPDLAFDNGIVHIIDRFLTIPPSILDILGPLGLTAIEGALTKATNLGTKLQHADSNQRRDVPGQCCQPAGADLPTFSTLTLFAPTNAAFEAIGSVFTNMSQAALDSVLAYHMVPDQITYLDPPHNISLPSLISKDVHITTSSPGNVFVNSAQAMVHNVLAAEGVIHIIDNVLNPNNTAARPASTTTTSQSQSRPRPQAPAFSDATPLPHNAVPFTTLVPGPSSTDGLSTGGKASVGVGIGIVLGGAVVIAFAVLAVLRRKRNRERSSRVKGVAGEVPLGREKGRGAADLPLGALKATTGRGVGVETAAAFTPSL